MCHTWFLMSRLTNDSCFCLFRLRDRATHNDSSSQAPRTIPLFWRFSERQIAQQIATSFGRPPLYHCIQGKHTFWYEITMVSWLFRTEKHIWNKAGLICLFYTHLWHFKTPFIKFFSDSTLPRQQWSAFGLPPLPPRQQLSAFGLPPPPPLAADVICGQPLSESFYLHFALNSPAQATCEFVLVTSHYIICSTCLITCSIYQSIILLKSSLKCFSMLFCVT